MRDSAEPIEQQDDTDAHRVGTYALLGRVLAGAPDSDILTLIAHSDGGAMEDVQDDLAAAWEELRSAAANAEPEALERQHHTLLVGVTHGLLIPYASWYLTGSLMEKPLVDLRSDLAALGIEREEGVSEPEDHAAALCDTMAWLIQDDEIGFETERRFFQEHLEPWIARFFEDMQDAEVASPFYRTVGRLGSAFTAVESRYYAMEA